MHLKFLTRHIWGLVHIFVTILLIVKWFTKPISVGQLGQDNIILYVLLMVLFTLIAFINYYRKKTIEILIPIVVFVLMIITIKIGGVIKRNIEKNNKPLIIAKYKRESLLLFKDNTFEYVIGSAEYIHYDRGNYKKISNKVVLDKTVNAYGNNTNEFFVTDTMLYIIENTSLDTIIFKIEHSLIVD